MIPLSPALRFFLYAHPAASADKSFDGLSGLVTSALTRDPTSGDVYVFLNRRRDRMKLLLWDHPAVAFSRQVILQHEVPGLAIVPSGLLPCFCWIFVIDIHPEYKS